MRLTPILAIAATTATLLGAAAPAAAQPRPSGAKAEVGKGVDDRAKLGQVINDQLFSFAELGFQEVETARYVTALLEKEGFAIERGVASLPTGWTASWTNGQGGPVIAIGSDVDGIPKASQTPGIPWHKPMVEGGPGHGEGHNSGIAVNIVAALAVKAWMTRTNTPGTLLLWPGVAEELLGGKAYMVRDGVFKGTDFAIFTHVDSQLRTFWGQPDGTGLVSVEYTFKGESAHSAGAPWRGKSALDAVTLMGVGWDMRREHLRPEQRSHYVVSDGGDQPNVVPSEAKIWFYVREQGFAAIQRMFDIANEVADGAAKMTDTTVTRRVLGSAAVQHYNRPMAEAAQANIAMIGLPKWDADDQAFAKAVQASLKVEKPEGLAVKPSDFGAPPTEPKSGGSDDIGDISWTVPTIAIRYPSNIPDLQGHHWSNAIAMATPIAHKGVQVGAKAVALTLVDILTKPALRTEATRYFATQTATQKYVPMLTRTDTPPTYLNTDIMARYKGELSKTYYDPAKYPTYLDQLGVKWPTLKKP